MISTGLGRTTMNGNITAAAATAVIILLGSAASAQRFALTPEQLERAARPSRDNTTALPVTLARLARAITTLSTGEIEQRLSAYKTEPFHLYVLPPFIRVSATAADAARRFAPAPIFSIDRINADGVVLSMVMNPQAAAESIDALLIRQVNGSLTRPAAAGGGAFYFPLDAFDRLPVTVICVGGRRNYETTLTEEDF